MDKKILVRFVVFLFVCLIAGTGYAQQPIQKLPTQKLPPIAPKPLVKEECYSFNLASTSVISKGGNWVIVDSTKPDIIIASFPGNQKADADRALDIIKKYGMNQVCFVRPGVAFQYELANAQAPTGTYTGEVCKLFDPGKLSINSFQGRWRIVEGHNIIFDFENNEAQAKLVLNIIKKHGFTRCCSVGKPVTGFQYMTKQVEATKIEQPKPVGTLPTEESSGKGRGLDINDFMIQDVCVRNGVVTSIDPYYCPTSTGWTRRDLRVGEALPYHKFSQCPSRGDLQISDSFPLTLPDGRRRYIHTLEYALHSSDLANWEAPLEWNYEVDVGNTFYKYMDGFNVDEADGVYAAIIGTQDPSGGPQPMWAPGCGLSDSWLLFPTNVADLVWGSTIAQLKIASSCPQTFDVSLTLWDKYSAFQYSSGKIMTTITSWHYGGDSVEGADHIEKFYYTREYGLTRWERWERNKTPLSFDCNGVDSYQGFVRVDCRDWSTNIRPDPNGGYSPYNIPIDSRFVQNNMLINGDFGGGRFVENENWSRISHSSTMHWSLVRDNPNSSNIFDRNHHLAMSCSACLGNAVYQDVQRGYIPVGSVLKFGGTVWSDKVGQMTITLFLRDASGAIKQRKDLVLNTGPRKQKFSSKITLTDNTVTNFRFTLYPATANTIFRADNLWLVRGP